ncbi:MAG: glycosyltransferase family 2 protein [Chlamydiae bacterium]|nr:glycosyltransferase family 2 protein [Chlamydiota bacterium]MBI3266910.1 glycosyltransferase family 2 protein [Chlamydiota bacterium]
MPAYHAEKTLEKTFRDIPKGSYSEIILVDDASGGQTVEIAKHLGLTVITHSKNRGYGGNQKTCYEEALKRGADVVVMIHPDYQYDSRLVPYIAGFLQTGVCDVVLGNRIRTREETLQGGMPVYKYFANRFLTFVMNVILGQNMGDGHSGLRAYTRKVLETIPFENNSNDYAFDAQFLAQCVYFGFRIGDIPVPVRYMKEASSINLKRSIIYGCRVLLTLVQYMLQKFKLCQFRIFESKNNQLTTHDSRLTTI